MPRNRVIYQSEALFAAPTGTIALNSSDHNLRRIQSCNYNFSIQRQDINQYGELAAIDRLIIQEPTVAVDMTYYFEPTGFNEEHLGLRVNSYSSEVVATGASSQADHVLEYIISSGDAFNQKNLFVLVSDAGIDANDTGASAMASTGAYNGIIGIGNAFLTNWSINMAVGAIPTVSCALEGQNINFTGWGSAGLPSATISGSILNPSIVNGSEVTNGTDALRYVYLPSGAGLYDSTVQTPAVRPGDVTVVLTQADDNNPVVGFAESDLKVQSCNFAVTIGREPIRKLGSLFAFAREITFPINCTFSLEAVVGDTAGKKVFDVLSNDAAYNVAVKLVGKVGSGTTQTRTAYIVLKNAKVDSQNITSSIGPNKTVSIEMSAQIGRSSGLHIYGKQNIA